MKSILNGNKPEHLDAEVRRTLLKHLPQSRVAMLVATSWRRSVHMWANAQRQHVRVVYCLAAEERREQIGDSPRGAKIAISFTSVVLINNA
ncbi:hypothetical protein [Paraburkholderia podalyriae]|uniref:Uncharacterized protein n=2 Tax=Paraburkholderia TaxID=1822464 RepID=A0ABR7Q1U4_9BURK|nr:hypothetical protein [Paraburkholderia podalyriae]MBC8752463.1 hypothetical protein [Paraburkholderia podalyriae]